MCAVVDRARNAARERVCVIGTRAGGSGGELCGIVALPADRSAQVYGREGALIARAAYRWSCVSYQPPVMEVGVVGVYGEGEADAYRGSAHVPSTGDARRVP